MNKNFFPYKTTKEAEEVLKGKIGHSTFVNMSRTVIKKKTFSGSAKAINNVFNELVKDFFKKVIKVDDQNFTDAYLGKNNDFKVTRSNEFIEVTTLKFNCLITWKYKIKIKGKKAKLQFWFVVTAPFPLNFTSLNSSKRRIDIMKQFLEMKMQIKNNIKIEERKWKK